MDASTARSAPLACDRRTRHPFARGTFFCRECGLGIRSCLATAVLTGLFFFVAVILHELAHAVVAKNARPSSSVDHVVCSRRRRVYR